MAIRMSELLADASQQLRFEPTPKRVRAYLDGVVAVDSTRAVLVWEPHWVVPAYAVPSRDLRIPPAPLGSSTRGRGARLDDSALEGYVLLEFDSFDLWQEEDQDIVAHPRDPYHRVDVRASSRHVRVEFDGELLAESDRPVLIFETGMPVRYYLPREDIRIDLIPCDTSTTCAYKGRAAYFSAEVGGRLLENLAWTLPEPFPEGLGTEGRIAFFNDRVDVITG